MFSTSDRKVNLLDPQNVAANRSGEITRQQKQWLTMAVGLGGGCAMASLSLFILVSLPFLLAILSTIEDRGDFVASLFGIGVLVTIALGLILSAGRSFPLALKVHRDQNHGAIRQSQGQLAFDKNGYVFQTGERRLLLPSPEDSGGLLPGVTYRVYYLEESGFVLSAEEILPPRPAQVRTALQDILAQANGFTLDDLMQNRNGEITPAQRMKPLTDVIEGGFLMLFSLLMGGLSAWGLIQDGLIGLLPLPLLVSGLFVLIAGWRVVSGLLDMSVSSLKQVQGLGRRKKIATRGGSRYYYVIGERRFQVSYRAYKALLEGIEYRAFYLPRTNMLISIEPIDVLMPATHYAR